MIGQALAHHGEPEAHIAAGEIPGEWLAMVALLAVLAGLVWHYWRRRT
jgi:hypothetical protein